MEETDPCEPPVHVPDPLRVLRLPHLLAPARVLLRLHDNFPLPIQDRTHDQIQIYTFRLWQEELFIIEEEVWHQMMMRLNGLYAAHI